MLIAAEALSSSTKPISSCQFTQWLVLVQMWQVHRPYLEQKDITTALPAKSVGLELFALLRCSWWRLYRF